jgi:hypothetical protein
MHKRNINKLQERKIQTIILRNSHYDRKICEVVSKITRLDVMAQLNEPVKVHLVPDIEKGEVLIDSRGRGSLQKT